MDKCKISPCIERPLVRGYCSAHFAQQVLAPLRKEFNIAYENASRLKQMLDAAQLELKDALRLPQAWGGAGRLGKDDAKLFGTAIKPYSCDKGCGSKFASFLDMQWHSEGCDGASIPTKPRSGAKKPNVVVALDDYEGEMS